MQQKQLGIAPPYTRLQLSHKEELRRREIQRERKTHFRILHLLETPSQVHVAVHLHLHCVHGNQPELLSFIGPLHQL